MSELLGGGLTSFRQFFYLSCPHPALSRKAGEGNGEREKIQNLFIAFF